MTNLIPTSAVSYPIPSFSDLNIMLFGQPGSGKTRLAALAPGVLMIGTEPGQYNVQAAVARCENWATFRDIINEIKIKRGEIKSGRRPVSDCPYTTFCIDIVDNLAGHVRDHICKQRGLAYPPTNDFGKTWSQIITEWKAGIADLMSLGNVIFISHCGSKETEIALENGMTAEVDQMIPTFSNNKTAQFLDGILSAMGYMYVDKSGKFNLTFRKSATIAAKDRTDMLAPYGPINIDWSTGKNAWQLVEELYIKMAQERGMKVISKRAKKGVINDSGNAGSSSGESNESRGGSGGHSDTGEGGAV